MAVVLAVAVTAVVLSSIGMHLQTSIATESPEPRHPNRGRLTWLGIGDDGERNRMFNEDLRDTCVIERVLTMERAGTWIVDCQSGKRVRIVHDRQGNLTSVIDLMQVSAWSAPEDELERQRQFKKALGDRCHVMSSRMESPGTWMVECSTGEHVRVLIRNGSIAEWSKVPYTAD